MAIDNVFAEAVTATQFHVKNNSGGQLQDQSILVYITPVQNADNWLYYAWQNLQPGEGGTAHFLLNQNVSAHMDASDGSYSTNEVAIAPAYVSLLTNSGKLQPVLNAPVLGTTVPAPTVTPQQSGIKNNTANPGSALYSVWSVNGNATARSLNQVSAGGTLSAFELRTTLYWAIGYEEEGPNYTYNQITTFQPYVLPAATPSVNVSLGYDNTTQQFTWTFTPPSAS